jgi:hypothetical protein
MVCIERADQLPGVLLHTENIRKVIILGDLDCLIMYPRGGDNHADGVSRATISRRKLLAVSGAIAVGGLSGCLSRVASSVTNTGASPAAAFAGERTEQFTLREPTDAGTLYGVERPLW